MFLLSQSINEGHFLFDGAEGCLGSDGDGMSSCRNQVVSGIDSKKESAARPPFPLASHSYRRDA